VRRLEGLKLSWTTSDIDGFGVQGVAEPQPPPRQLGACRHGQLWGENAQERQCFQSNYNPLAVPAPLPANGNGVTNNYLDRARC
jgi:hypothetical protein